MVRWMDAIDLTDLDLFESGDPHAAWRTLRREAPVYWNRESDGPGFWAVTRYADVSTLYRSSGLLTSERGMLLGVNRGQGDPAAGKMLVVTDPPRHRQLRRIFEAAFSVRMVGRMEDEVRALVREVLDAAGTGSIDFTTQVAERIPVAAICRMLGVPAEDHSRLVRLTTAAFCADDREYRLQGSAAESAAAAHGQIFGYMADLVRSRRQAPADDLVGLLLTAEVDGARLTSHEILLNCLNLLIGGNETTRHAASGGMLALTQRPDQWAALREDPARVEAAVEEILRWTTPGMYVLRTALRDLELGGQAIARGDAVTLWNVSANRDEDVFPDAFEFRVDRSPNRHLTFGIGPHHCLGAALARLELRLLLRELLGQVRWLELAGEPRRVRSNVVNGIKHLPVRLHPN
jgi:cytochrome P450